MLRISIEAIEEQKVRVTLSNDGEESLLVNGRLALNAPFSPEPFREVSLAISRDGGEPLPFMSRINVGFPADEHFVELDAGQSIGREFEPARYYQLEPGEYAVVATYENQSDPEEGEAWKGTLESEPAKLTVN